MDQALASEVRAAAEESSKASRWRRIKRLGFAGAVGAIVTVIVYALLSGLDRDVPLARDLSGMVLIPGGAYRNHEGKPTTLSSFMIDAHEVTIAEYVEFLDALEGMGASERRAYDHGGQPRTKLDHLPDNWPMVLGAARRGANFDELKFGLNHPVTGVDWWDAHALSLIHI